MRADKSLLLVVAIFLCSGCHRSLERHAYIDWVRGEHSGLHTKISIDGYTFDIQYEPVEYVILQNNPSITNTEFNNILKDFKGLQYYRMTIGLIDEKADFIKYDISSDAEMQSKIYYFSYRFQEDIHLVENGKKMPCVLYHFERSADLKNRRTFVVGFENTGDVSSPVKFVINSSYLSSLPIVINLKKKNPSVIL